MAGIGVHGGAAAAGGGGAVTVADGADVAQGTTTDVAWVAGAGTVISLLKKIASAGGSAVSIADGANVVEGALADAAIVTDTTGTINGKLRGLVKWAFERMPTSLGQKTMAASLAVVFASDQSALTITSAALTILSTGTSNTGTLGALNAEVILPMVGRVGAGFSLIDSSFVGVITIYQSFDGGTNYTETNGYRPFPATNISRQNRITSPGSMDGVIDVGGGATHVKLKVTTYTSGSMAAALSATNSPSQVPPSTGAKDDIVQGITQVGGRYASATGALAALWLTDAQPATNAMGLATREVGTTGALSGSIPTSAMLVGIKDLTDSSIRAFEATQSAPAGTERGLVVRNIPSGTQPVSSTTLALETTQTAGNVLIGAVNETAPASDTANSGLNGRLQRIAQRLTSLIALLPAALVGGRLDTNIGAWLGSTAPTVGSKTSANSVPVVVASDQAEIPVKAGTNLNTSALALDATVVAGNVLLGAVNETAPASDTANSGLNGRLQRIAQRLTSMIALLPAALVGGRLDTNIGAWLGSTAPTVGSKTSANSVPVVVASDQGTIPVKEVKAATPTQTSVSVLTTNTVILAANANRLGATIYNESGAIAYVKLGVTSSLTSYTIQIAIGGYYEVPFGYTGGIDGITVAITAVVRVTELAA